MLYLVMIVPVSVLLKNSIGALHVVSQITRVDVDCRRTP
jgi:hypothetical protein